VPSAGWDGDELVEILEAPSSAQAKANITNLDSVTADIMSLRPVRYDVILPGLESQGCIGLIAEEVEIVFPHLIRTNKDEFGARVVVGIDYAKLTPILLKEIIDLREEVSALKEQFTAELSTITNALRRISHGETPQVGVNNDIPSSGTTEGSPLVNTQNTI